MPASVVLSAIYGSTFMAAAALGATGLAVATFAINFAASYIITRVFGQKAPTQKDNGVRQQVPPSSTNSIPVVYGDAWMGGTFVDAVLTTNQQAMYYVLAISNISTNGQLTYDTSNFYYGDRLITFDSIDTTKVISLTDGAGNVDTKVSGNLFINLYTSTAAGVITNVTGTSPSTFMGGSDIAAGLRWSGTRQMNGLAFAIVKLIYNRDAGTTSLQPVTFKVKHALNGTGFAKPGDVLYDYLTSTTYGGAVPASQVNSTACAALNTYSDATISYTPSGGGSATQARYRVNGLIDTGISVLENVDKILTACDSWLSYQAYTGQWTPVINKAESTSFAFNDSNIIGEIKVSVVDLASSINQIEVSFPFKGNKDQPEYVFLQTPAGLLYPNEPVNKYSTSFDLVNDSVQATYLANRILEQAREDLIVSFSTAYTGIQVDAGDVVSVTNADYGWSAKLFRVTKVQEASLPDGNLGARIEAAEYNSAVYDDASITQFSSVSNSGLTSGYYFAPLSAPTFTDQSPSANPPYFSVVCDIPTSGRITVVTLYYTDVIVPLQKDWKVWTIQTASYGESFTPGLALKFPNVVVGSGTYYFAFTVGNELATSDLSTSSAAFNWATVTSESFIASFSPASNSVSRTGGVPSFTGLVTRLYGSAFGATVDFVTSQTDSDVAFVNNTWRIGGSSTTGNADITTTGGLVMGSITDGGTYAQWGIPTAMTSTPATLTVPVRYKNSAGAVSQASTASLQFIFVDNGTNGTDGTKSANPSVYQWAASIPAGPTGTGTYTWATNTIAAAPAGWTLTPGTSPSPGFTLWAATVNLVATASATSSSINWTLASILAVGAAGSNGVNGNDGSSSRICFSRIASNPSPISGNITVSGDNRPSSVQSNATWGLNVSWFASDPNPSSTDSLYQADGVYNPVTNQTVWSTPYISSLKVGTLSAITVNTGALTVQDALTINTTGHIKGGQTAYNTGTGFFLGYSGAAYSFSIGSSTQSLTWSGTALTITGNIYGNGAAEFTGTDSGAFSLTTAVKANGGNAADIAVAAFGRLSTLTYPVYAFNTSTFSSGSTPPSAVFGNTNRSTGIGVLAANTGGGTALKIEGLMAIDNTTLVTNLNADKLDGKDASAFVEIASGQANSQYLYYVNNNTAPTDPVNRAAWIKVSTNGGDVVWFPGYI
jgi:hypothetical protein